jgi:hypothetical protein
MFVKMFNQVNGLLRRLCNGRTNNVRAALEKKFGATCESDQGHAEQVPPVQLGAGSGGQAKAVNMLSKFWHKSGGPSDAESVRLLTLQSR